MANNDERSNPRGKVLVTVIMPIRNEEHFIAKSLGALLQQTYPADDYEIIVVDGDSTDSTVRIVGELSAQCPLPRIKVICNPLRTVAPGLNAGIEHASGDIVIRVDGHTVVAGNYVEQCVETLRRTQASNVGGRMNPVGNNASARAIALAMTSRFGVGGARFHYSAKEERVDTVYMGAWPLSVLHRAGGFDEYQVRTQDSELNYRLRSMGGEIVLSPTIQSTYYCRATIRKLASQYAQYGFWRARVIRKYPAMAKPRQLLPGLFVALLSLLVTIGMLYPVSAAIAAALFLFYCAAAFVAALLRCCAGNIAVAPLVSVCFAVMHLSFGAGSIAGLRWWLVSLPDSRTLPALRS